MKFVFALIALFGPRAFAFTEMARIGYQNCASCHVSPTGGGVLTAYGRGMAADILSTWHYEGEEALGHGLIKDGKGEPYHTPEWLNVGGNSRWIQTYTDTPQATQRQSFPMQNQMEAAVRVMKLWLVGNLAIEGGPAGSPNYGMLTSNRLYALYNYSDEIYLRAGKFSMPFGINQPNHMAVIANNLNWGYDTESDNLEAGYIGEKYNLILTGNFGRPDHSSLQVERGIALNAAYNLGTTHKLGWSAFSGNGSDTRRFVTGPYVTLAFWRKLVLLSQVDMQWKENKDPSAGAEQRGVVTFNRLQYEVYQGVQPYLIHQVSYLNTDSLSSRFDSYGIGTMWFPRPHFEFWLEWDKQRMMASNPDYTDSAWVTAQYYF